MSIYGYFVCSDCKVQLWLGKALHHEEHGALQVDAYHLGDNQEPPMWTRERTNTLIWKMLADHTGHTIRVLLEHDLDRLVDADSYRRIGGDSVGDITVEEYLAGTWRRRP